MNVRDASPVMHALSGYHSLGRSGGSRGGCYLRVLTTNFVRYGVQIEFSLLAASLYTETSPAVAPPPAHPFVFRYYQHALPAFMRPGGGMVPVVLLTGCDAATIAPDSTEGCETTPMLLGYTRKVMSFGNLCPVAHSLR